MSLPIQPNSVVGTRLLDLLSIQATSNEVATFGFSNSTGVKIRMYDINNPATGALVGYSSCNTTFSFTRETGNLLFGINTANPTKNAYVVGDSIVTGTFTTCNLTVSGSSASTSGINTQYNQNLSLYLPSGTDSTGTSYKNVTTNDSTYTNRVLFSTTLSTDKYLISISIPYKNTTPSFVLGGSVATIAIYATTPDLFDPTTQTPIQSQTIEIGDAVEQLSANVTLYVNVVSSTNYVIVVNGLGESLQFGGNGYSCIANILSTTTIGTKQSYNVRTPLATTAIRQTFIPSQSTSNFIISTSNIYQITDPRNVEVYNNGLKLAYYSPTSNDYIVSYSNIIDTTTNKTNFTISTVSLIPQNNVVDIVIWPETSSNNTYVPRYLYQTITNTVGTQYINVASNTTGYVGIGTYNGPQLLSVSGQSYFSSNVGIGTVASTSLLTVYDTRNDRTSPMTVQQTATNVEFPPVGISNIYFAPDYTDMITSIDISQSLSNLEYPPSAMSYYTNDLLSSYGAGTYTASSSGDYSTSYTSWMAFDKTLLDPNGCWGSAGTFYNSTGTYTGTNITYDVNNNSYLGDWLQIQLPQSILLTKYSLTSRSGNLVTSPVNWYILGSIDNLNWNLIDTRLSIAWTSTSQFQLFSILNPQKFYSYYRIVVNKTTNNTGTNDANIGEWRLFTNSILGQNIYPKYKATIPYYTSVNPYGLGQYQIWANTIQDYSYSTQTLPSGLFTKTVGTTSNTVWASYSNVYTGTVDTVSSNLPIIYAQFPDLIQLNSYSITARGGNALETPSKWTLFGSNTTISTPWQTVDIETGYTNWSAFQTMIFSVSNSNAYNFYKLELYRNSSPVPTRMSMGEIRFYGTKQTTEPRLIVSPNGFIGIGTTNPITTIHVYGDMNVSGALGDPILRTGPYVTFDGSSNNRDTFLRWVQYVTSAEYRFKFKRPTEIASSTWWNAGNSVAQYDTYVYSTISISIPVAYTYLSGVLLPDGRVMFLPYTTTNVGIFNPSTNTFSTTAVGQPPAGVANAYLGGVLLPDGRVVCVPYYTTTNIGIFNPSTNTFSTIPINPTLPASAYFGGVLLPDGRVLFVPYGMTTLGLFNPSTNIYTTFIVSPALPVSAYTGGVLLPDGRVVFVPASTTYIGIFNSLTNTYSTTAVGLIGPGGFYGGVLLPDGRVVFVPHTSTTVIGIYNYITNTYSTIPITSTTPSAVPYSYSGGVLLPDGRVMFVPVGSTTVGIFNPTTNTYTTITGMPGNDTYRMGVSLPDGRVIFIPSAVGAIGIMTPTQIPRPPPLELCYHPCFNKF